MIEKESGGTETDEVLVLHFVLKYIYKLHYNRLYL